MDPQLWTKLKRQQHFEDRNRLLKCYAAILRFGKVNCPALGFRTPYPKWIHHLQVLLGPSNIATMSRLHYAPNQY